MSKQFRYNSTTVRLILITLVGLLYVLSCGGPKYEFVRNIEEVQFGKLEATIELTDTLFLLSEVSNYCLFTDWDFIWGRIPRPDFVGPKVRLRITNSGKDLLIPLNGDYIGRYFPRFAREDHISIAWSIDGKEYDPGWFCALPAYPPCHDYDKSLVLLKGGVVTQREKVIDILETIVGDGIYPGIESGVYEVSIVVTGFCSTETTPPNWIGQITSNRVRFTIIDDTDSLLSAHATD